jgi:hypothetical protein
MAGDFVVQQINVVCQCGRAVLEFRVGPSPETLDRIVCPACDLEVTMNRLGARIAVRGEICVVQRSKLKTLLSIVVLLLMPSLLGASGCERGSGDTIVQEAPLTHPVYESADLGQVAVVGEFVEAASRVTINADEIPLAFIVEGDYVPAMGNAGGASAELVIFDTRGDQDPTNDLLAGSLGPSPFARAQLSVDQPGAFSLRVPLTVGARDKLTLTGGTWSCRLRISTTTWYGTITGFKLRVVTLKGAKAQASPESFVRDQ